jgi:hypothetical protein
MINTSPVRLLPDRAFAGFNTAVVPLTHGAVAHKGLAQTALVSDVVAWFVMKLAIEFLILRGSYKSATGHTIIRRLPRVLKPVLAPVQQKLRAVMVHRHRELTSFVRSMMGFLDGWVLYEAGLRYRNATRLNPPNEGHHGFNDRVLDILVTERVEILAIKLFEALNTSTAKPLTLDQRYLQKARCLMQETGASVFAGLLVLGAALHQSPLTSTPLDAVE